MKHSAVGRRMKKRNRSTRVSTVTLIDRLLVQIEEARKSKTSLEDDPYVRLAFQRLELDLKKIEDHALLLRAVARVLHNGRLKPVGFLNDLIKDAEKIV